MHSPILKAKSRAPFGARLDYGVAIVNYRIPCSTIDLATFIKPAMFAPFI